MFPYDWRQIEVGKNHTHRLFWSWVGKIGINPFSLLHLPSGGCAFVWSFGTRYNGQLVSFWTTSASCVFLPIPLLRLPPHIDNFRVIFIFVRWVILSWFFYVRWFIGCVLPLTDCGRFRFLILIWTGIIRCLIIHYHFRCFLRREF